MFKYNEVTTLHLELTDKCNANCPMCPRSLNGAFLNPNLRLTELTLENIKAILPIDFIQQLQFVYLCGNFGDPIMACDTYEILSYFREVNSNIKLAMFSNASARDSNWWGKLGKLLSRPGDFVRFSIDGLEDTNHLYRQNTKWSRIMTNAKSYIAAGGVAFWDYLVFEHNYHQIEQASCLAKDLGFKEFYTKYSSRFVNDSGKLTIESFPVYNDQGIFQRVLRPLPENYLDHKFSDKKFPEQIYPVSRNQIIPWSPDPRSSEYSASFLKECVSCQAKDNHEIYISSEGFVLPCCWTAFAIRSTIEAEHINQLRGYVLDQGLDTFSIFKNSLQTIIESNFFQKTLVEGWQQTDPKSGQIMLCQKFCGKSSLVKKEFSNSKIL
ncbi:MAG: hypothetical protein WA160_10850 [Pseudobdellovibrio sp.]